MQNALKSKRPFSPEKAVWLSFTLLIFLLTYHPDILETSNHSYLFLESVFSGNFFDFYNYVEARPLEIYYLNTANYNILVYLLFGVWQLPFYIVTKLFSLPLNEYALMIYTKALCAGFYLGCAFMIKEICVKLKMSQPLPYVSAIFFLFNPISFFSPIIMGQYDSICLFFMLWALKFYLDSDMKRFSLLIGVAGIFKFFAFLVFIPLLLLKEKKLFPIIKNSLLSLFLFLPSTLLFLGRTSNASMFTSLMFDRLFEVTIPTGFAEVSLFMIGYAAICFFCFLNKNRQKIDYLALYIPLAVFALLFITIRWHPQWLILLIPFVVITTFLQRNKLVWWYVDIILCFGFFMTCFIEFPRQTGANIFAGSLIGFLTDTGLHNVPDMRTVSYFINLIPYLVDIVPICFIAALIVNIVFKYPLASGETLSDRLSDSAQYDSFSYRTAGYSIFIVGFVGFWLFVSIFEYLNAFNLI